MSNDSKPFGSLIAWAEPTWYHNLPSPFYTPSHQKFRAVVRAWVDEHLMDVSGDWEEQGKIDPKVYAQAAKDGLLLPFGCGGRIPKHWVNESDGRKIIGGITADEYDEFHDLILYDEFARAGAGPSMGLSGGLIIGLPPLKDFGSTELQEKFIPPILRGEKRICLAITEPDAGSDVKNLSTTAVRSEDGRYFIVNGVKKWITNGIYSDYFTTAVRTRGKPGDMDGISLLLIPRTEGVKTQSMKMSGVWSSGTTLVNFEDVKVPIENLIGEENSGFKYIMTNFNHERMMMIYQIQRFARVCIEDSLAHAQQRKVFGKPLIEAGVIRNKFAHMAKLVESQQGWIENVTYQLSKLSKEESNALLGGTTALMKAHASQVLELVVREAVQIFGGLGMTRSGKGERVERSWRDLKASSIPGGSEEIMLDLGVRQQLKIAQALAFSRTKL